MELIEMYKLIKFVERETKKNIYKKVSKVYTHELNREVEKNDKMWDTAQQSAYIQAIKNIMRMINID